MNEEYYRLAAKVGVVPKVVGWVWESGTDADWVIDRISIIGRIRG